MRFLLGFLVLFLVSGCDKGEDANCDDTFPFTGIEWVATSVMPQECIWMLFKHEYRGRYYYSVGNHCVDMATFVAACDGVNICNNDGRFCDNILNKGKNLGIIAVEK